LKEDMIKPFYRRMTTAGCPVAVKLYPGCGHFLHSDLPDQFVDDAVQFVSTGNVHGPVDPNTF